VGELTWVENAKYDVVRKVDLQQEEDGGEEKLPEGENISHCPVTPTAAVIDGGRKRFSICPGTDLQGASAKITKGIKSADACVKICSAIPTCVKAVWDSEGFVCHVKAPEETNTLIWVTDKRFDVISLDTASNPAFKGKWGDLIRLPVIPVAGYVVPEFPTSSRMLVFSSWGPDAFGGASGLTQFADYNFNTGAVSQRAVANTKHDMFCPGMSSLEDGRMLISGGSDAAAVSLYDPKSNTFAKGPEMKIPRGYQTSVTTSEGKVFELGGSYSGKRGGKNGEIYDPETNEWTLLPGAKTDPMLTVDGEGVWRTDNVSLSLMTITSPQANIDISSARLALRLEKRHSLPSRSLQSPKLVRHKRYRLLDTSRHALRRRCHVRHQCDVRTRQDPLCRRQPILHQQSSRGSFAHHHHHGTKGAIDY